MISILSDFYKYERMKLCYKICIVPIYLTVFCINLGFQEFISWITCISEIINITLLFDEEEVFLKAALNPASNSQILHVKLNMLSLPLLSFVKSFVI